MNYVIVLFLLFAVEAQGADPSPEMLEKAEEAKHRAAIEAAYEEKLAKKQSRC